MKSFKGLFLLVLVCLIALSASCRRNQPSLIDTNQSPETELWYAPADSTEYEYLVHVYWRGLDRDGTVVRYIWTITDTIEAEAEKRWNPADRLSDYQLGRLTTKSDSIFSFTAYRNVGGVGLKKNLQAFHIASIDDNGVIDPTPAAIEFVATIDKLPEMRFSTEIDSFYKDTRFPKGGRPYNPSRLDTVGMYRDFSVGYHGLTTNGEVRGLKWYPISNVELRGADIWTADLTDSLQYFANNPDSLEWFTGLDLNAKEAVPFWRHYEVLPSGIFRFAAKCLDGANAESPVDPGQFKQGVAQIVINFDPDTEIFDLINIYKVGDLYDTVHVNFADEIPDTVPFRSWVTLFYRGWDNPGDISVCEDDVNKCINYQLQYERTSERFAEMYYRSPLLPEEGPQDTNPCGIGDSTSMNIGTAKYEIRVRAVDENGRVDGRPEYAFIGGEEKSSIVNLIGNYDPTLDSLVIYDHLNRRIESGDTIIWKWSDVQPVPTSDFTQWTKNFSFRIRAYGHDNPKELPESGVKSWYYYFTSLDPVGIYKDFARAGGWVNGSAVNELDDQFQVQFRYPITDINGDAVFSNPPPWVGVKTGDQDTAFLYEMTMKGRDTEIGETYKQEIWLKRASLPEFVCPPNPDEPISERKIQNDYPTARYGRWTQEAKYRFYFQLVDDRDS